MVVPRVLGIHPHLLKIEVGEQVGGREAAAGVAGLGAVNALDHAHADFARGDLELLALCFCHRFHAPF